MHDAMNDSPLVPLPPPLPSSAHGHEINENHESISYQTVRHAER